LFTVGHKSMTEFSDRTQNGKLQLGEQGSVMIPVLVGCVLISVLAAASLQGAQTLLELGTRDRLRSESKNLKATLVLLYNDKTECTNSLLTGSFGTELQQKIKDPTYQTSSGLAISYPPADVGQPTTPFIGIDLAYDHVVVKQVLLSTTTRIQPAGQGYLTTVLITFKQSAMAPVEIPLYVVTDAAGTPKSCYMSTYVDKLEGPTLEDDSCKTSSAGKKNHWDPGSSRCV
jgi:hypothetical protein